MPDRSHRSTAKPLSQTPATIERHRTASL